MQLRFLGKESKSGDSPTLYATDRDTYLVQGYTVPPAMRANLDLAEGNTCVVIYDRLLGHLARDGITGTPHRRRPIIAAVNEESSVIEGAVVTDTRARARMRIPDHEDCVEIPKAALAALMGVPGWT
ncbi:hypothetical protein GCM10027570_05320 [Streptomonospora sediminis]